MFENIVMQTLFFKHSFKTLFMESLVRSRQKSRRPVTSRQNSRRPVARRPVVPSSRDGGMFQGTHAV